MRSSSFSPSIPDTNAADGCHHAIRAQRLPFRLSPQKPHDAFKLDGREYRLQGGSDVLFDLPDSARSDNGGRNPRIPQHPA